MNKENPSIITPIIHLNGTSAEKLGESYQAALDAFDSFLRAWNDLEFNERDYYPVKGSWDMACNQRGAMREKIEEIEGYLLTIRLSIQDQTH